MLMKPEAAALNLLEGLRATGEMAWGIATGGEQSMPSCAPAISIVGELSVAIGDTLQLSSTPPVREGAVLAIGMAGVLTRPPRAVEFSSSLL